MTTGTTGPEALAPVAALKVAEVLDVIACPLCGVAGAPRCHPLSRLRVAVRLAVAHVPVCECGAKAGEACPGEPLPCSRRAP